MLLAKSLVAIGETGTTGTRVLHRVWLPPSLFELTEIERGVGGLPCYHCISAYPGTTGIRVPWVGIPTRYPTFWHRKFLAPLLQISTIVDFNS